MSPIKQDPRNFPHIKEYSQTTDTWSRFNYNKNIIRPRDLPLFLGISKTTCWRLAKDPSSCFPQRIYLSPGAVGYFRHELEAWLKSRQIVED